MLVAGRLVVKGTGFRVRKNVDLNPVCASSEELSKLETAYAGRAVQWDVAG